VLVKGSLEKLTCYPRQSCVGQGLSLVGLTLCVRVLDLGKDTIQTKTYGTVTYMPPELLMEGKMTKACDVYGYGVIVW